VFVVGYLGDWRRAAAVLFERESLSGHPAPSREAREEAAPTVTQGTPFRRTGNERVGAEAIVPVGYTSSSFGGYHQGVGTIRAAGGDLGGGSETLHVFQPIAFGAQNSASQGDSVSTEVTPTLDKSKTPAVAWSIMPMNSGKDYKARVTDVAQPLMAGGPVGGNQGGDFVQSPAVAIQNATRGASQNGLGITTDGPMYTLDVGSQHAVAFAQNQIGEVREGDIANTLNTNFNASGRNTPMLRQASKVRRLTPTECERLQGFPDDYTQIPWRNKPAENCPDGPRYKAMGNSMAVPVMRWIGERISMVEDIVDA
jgi:DNA (cytosine-5)-methyltransferase 1